MIIEISTELDHLAPSPLELLLPHDAELPSGALQLREQGGRRRVFPAQSDGTRLVVLVSEIEAGDGGNFHVELAAEAGGVQLKEEGAHGLSIVLPDGAFTTYRTDPEGARPYFYPLMGPGGKAVTRNYPMKNVAGESHDHPHHRSFWTAYGEVNGVDDWSEEKNHGYIKHKSFSKKEQGAMFGGFTAANAWVKPDGTTPLVDEVRTIRVYNAGPELRMFDYTVELMARHGDVVWGDTKEGGLLSIRLADSMTEKKGAGKMVNDHGGAGMDQCWGKPAQWLDYSGPVDGQVLGVAMMDHPSNFHHPCRWHARDYGLVGTNPFALGAFEKGHTEGYTQKNGATLRFQYRVIVHKGDAKEAHVEDRYHAWVQGVNAKIKG